MSAGILTILFTDVVDSTRLFGRHGEEGAETVRLRHFATLREAVAETSGEEVKNVGDGLMVVFGSAVEAASCAVAMQQATHRHNVQHPDSALGLRVGLHVGEPSRSDDDYFGTPVVIAKRLCDTAEGGQIIASDLVRALTIGRQGLAFRPLGERSLKGLDEAVTTFELAWEPQTSSAIPLPAELSRGIGMGFVSRADELDRLRSAYKRVCEGGFEIVLLAGEPGIGKTRLASEFAKLVHEDGAIVLLGRCDELSSVPYRPFVEALTHLVSTGQPEDVATIASHAPRLLQLVPQIAQHIEGIDPVPPADPETDRYHLLEAVSNALADVSRNASVLLILDDLHWADGPSLQMLRHIERASVERRILVCATYRETDLGRTHPLADVLADLRRREGVTRIHLKGFDTEGIVEWLEVAGGHEIGRRGHRLAEALFETTDGNPFFVQQIVAHFVETGTLVQRDGVWTFDMPLDELGIPEGIKEVVGRRLARLSEECNKVLDAASVIGREFDLDVLEAMTGGDALDAVDEALANQVIAEVQAPAPRYTFTHALMRQTLYDELHLARKQRMHLRAAEAIEQRRERQVEAHLSELAAHYRLAGAAAEPHKAIDYSLQAGEAARRIGAWEEAIAEWKAAIELLDETGDRPKRARALERLGDLIYITGIDTESGLAYLERALADYEATGDERRAAAMHSRIGRSLMPPASRLSLDIRKGMQHLRAAQEILEPMGPSHQLGFVYVALATGARMELDPRLGIDACERALEIDNELPHAGLRVGALAEYGLHLQANGRVSQGREVLERALEEARATDDPWLLFHAALNNNLFNTLLYENHDALHVLDEALANAAIARAPALEGFLALNRFLSLWNTGRIEEARATRELARDRLESLAFIGGVEYAWDGRFEEAREEIEGQQERGRETGFFLTVANGAHAAGWIGLYQGDHDYGRAAAQELIDITEPTDARILHAWGLLFLALFDALDGRTAANAARFSAIHQVIEGHECHGFVGLVQLAEAVDAAARGDDPTGMFVAALERARRESWIFLEAEVLHQWGRATGEISKLHEAISIYERIGAPSFYADRVRANLPS